jgi:RimJ/RimL family protein N-acetyltransferase
VEIELKKINAADAPQWLEMQIGAFMPLLLKYGDHGTSPAAETLEQVVKRMNSPFCEHFFILGAGEPVGGVRTAWRTGAARYRIGGIFILPQFQDMGIGQIAMQLAEARYPNAVSWELDTPLQEERNLHFYEKLGYRREGGEDTVNDQLTLAFYKKYL